MTLLDLLAKQPDIKLMVAHFNHGIREDSIKDEAMVRRRAKELGLPLAVGYGHLGPKTSEASARQARYAFLEGLVLKHRAKAIITAHHQDDWLETAILNLLRGTNWRGLVAIAGNKKVIRPLLSYRKTEILVYARHNKLKWREDLTNKSDIYLRNYVRRNIMIQLSYQQRQILICNIEKVAKIQHQLDSEIAKLSQNVMNDLSVDRQRFTALPTVVGNELMVHWLRQIGLPDIDRHSIERLNVAFRTSKGGAIQPVKRGISVKIGQKSARFAHSL